MSLMTTHSARGTGTVGLIIVDHGSRRRAANEMLERFVERFAADHAYCAVEPAHMELAEPSIRTAFDRCVAQGASCIVVSPYFLLPGKHWTRDIPALSAAAAADHPGISYLVSAPIALHPLMTEVVQSRVEHCLAHAAGLAPECEVCAGTGRCAMMQAGSTSERS